MLDRVLRVHFYRRHLMTIRSRIALIGSTALVLLLSFTAAAFAAGGTEDPALIDLARPVWEAAQNGQWWIAIALALVLATAAFKRYAPGKLGRWANRDAGGALLVLVGSFGGALATGLAAAGTNALTLALIWTAGKIAIGAAGGYSLIKKLLVDPLLASDWYQNRAPGWLKSILALALWAFTRPTPTEEAEAAGSAAVKKDPPTGVDGVVGGPMDV